MSTERHHSYRYLNTHQYFAGSMANATKAIGIVALLLVSMLSTGCLALPIQRELMESWRDQPIHLDKPVEVGWSVSFDTGTSLDSVMYQNETELVFDETVAKLTIIFREQLPWSDQIDDFIGNDTNQVRYVEARMWEPDAISSGGEPFWEQRATKDSPLDRFEWAGPFVQGKWILEVEARGYGVTAPIEQVSFHDQFDLFATITKPCVRFPQTHAQGECTFLSELDY